MQSTMSPYQILQADWHDLMPLRQLEKMCFEEDAWPLLDLLGVLTIPGIVRLKAVAGEQMIGFIAADLMHKDGCGWVSTVGVDPAYRRHGVGRALMLAVEERISARCIRLCVRRSNYGAIQMYTQLGYRLVDTWARYYSGGEDAYVLEKTR